MKKTFLFYLLLTLCCCLTALPVDKKTAQKAAENYLRFNQLQHSNLTLYTTLNASNGDNTIYIFNIGNEGFIMVSANDEVEPILGYSFNGAYDTSRVNPLFRDWSQTYSQAIEQYSQSVNVQADAQAILQWNALKDNNASFFAKNAAKNVNPIVQSKWGQGWGYNEYCPSMDGNHVVVGCVATAMAQIIRYWEYPRVGFGSSSYRHSYYGRQTVYHDSVIYDYSNMPLEVHYWDIDQTEINAISLLSYHCGVSVSMNYQNPNYTSGSGASLNDVPEGLSHFGYVDSYHLVKDHYPETEWKAILMNELDHGRPMVYQGFAQSGGGHAFVCDGYRNNGEKFHFNWGWDGYQDGYFTLSDMNSYVLNQAAVINIHPSGIASLHDTLYCAPDGRGDGSSWSSPTSNISAASQLRGIYHSGCIWVKEGTYYGDTTMNEAVNIADGVYIYGGFAGNETLLNDRDPQLHPTIIDGQNKQACINSRSYNKTTILDGFTLRRTSGTIEVNNGLKIRNCHFTENSLTSGNLISLSSGLLSRCTFSGNTVENHSLIHQTSGDAEFNIITNNTCPTAFHQVNGSAHTFIIAHNSGNGVQIDRGTLVCSDIIANGGKGLVSEASGTIRNSIVWNNGEPDVIDSTSTVKYCALNQEQQGEGNIILDDQNEAGNGPHFVAFNSAVGICENDDDYHLTAASPCFNTGDTIRTGLPKKDMDNMNRLQGSRTDIGCYELSGVGIGTIISENTLVVYPNPTSNVINITTESNEPIQLYNCQGIIVGRYPAQTNQISLSSLPHGIYLLKQGVSTLKVLKQ